VIINSFGLISYLFRDTALNLLLKTAARRLQMGSMVTIDSL